MALNLYFSHFGEVLKMKDRDLKFYNVLYCENSPLGLHRNATYCIWFP